VQIREAALERGVLRAVKGALTDEVAERAVEVALDDLRKRIEAAEPKRAEADLAKLDAKIERTLDLAIELGDMGTAKERLKALRVERARVAGELASVRIDLPSIEDLLPRVREKLRELEATLMADVAQGRLALGGLLGGQRLRVYRDGRIEGSAILAPEMLRAPRTSSGPADRDVAGEGFEPPTSGL
jgi:hypothetical protein